MSAVSGLTDTLSGDPVVLSILGNVITGAVNAGADVVFTIALDPVTGRDHADPVSRDGP